MSDTLTPRARALTPERPARIGSHPSHSGLLGQGEADGGAEKQWGIRLTPPPGKFAIEIIFELAGLIAAIAFGVFAIKSVTIANKANQYSSEAVLLASTSNQLALLAVCLSITNSSEDIAAICSRVISGAATAVPSVASLLFSPLPPRSTSTQSTTTASVVTSSFLTTRTVLTTVNGSPALATITTTEIVTIPSQVTSSTTPTVTASAPPMSSSSAARGSHSTVAIGAAVGSVGGLILLGVGVCLLFRARMKRKQKSAADSHEEWVEGAIPHEQAVESSAGAVEQNLPPESSVRQRHKGQPEKSWGLAHGFKEIFVDSKVVNL